MNYILWKIDNVHVAQLLQYILGETHGVTSHAVRMTQLSRQFVLSDETHQRVELLPWLSFFSRISTCLGEERERGGKRREGERERERERDTETERDRQREREGGLQSYSGCK